MAEVPETDEETPGPIVADWLCQFGPRDVKPWHSETIILTFNFGDSKP